MIDMSDVRGLTPAIDELEVAITSGSNVIVLAGAPGCGAIMVARRVPELLGPLSDFEAGILTDEYRGARLIGADVRCGARPFRAPHHTVSSAGLVGPGRRAGEVHLARFGVLMLDDAPNFSIGTLDVLGHRLANMRGRPLVIATMSECPCGWIGSGVRKCVCKFSAVRRWRDHCAKAIGLLGESVTIQLPSLSVADMSRSQPYPGTSQEIATRIAERRTDESW